MNCLSDNVMYLTEADKEACASMPTKDIGALSKEEEELVMKYRQRHTKDRAALQRLMLRWLNQPKSDKEV